MNMNPADNDAPLGKCARPRRIFLEKCHHLYSTASRPFQTYPYLPGNWTIALQSGREPFLRFFILKREKSFVHAESYSVVELLDW